MVASAAACSWAVGTMKWSAAVMFGFSALYSRILLAVMAAHEIISRSDGNK